MKRKVFGFVLLGLGAFLLAAGIIATAWAPGVVKKTPLDVEQITNLDGVVNKIDLESGELVENPVKVQTITKTDSDASDDDTVVWVSTACVVIDVDDPPACVDGDDPRLVSATTDVFATDRVSAEAVGDFEGLPADAVPHEGLVNKWPFDAEKKNYDYWDGLTGKAWPAVYTRTDNLLDIDVYVYTVTISDAPIEIADGVDGTYDNVVEIWVEPKTGAIQQQTQDQQRYLADGTQVLDLNIGFTEEQQKAFQKDAEDNMMLLRLITFWLPVVGFVGGGLAVVAGGLLLLSSRGRNGSASTQEKQLADA